MAIENAKAYLKQYGLDTEVLEFDVSSATVEDAAKALNTDGKHIAKTLAFRHDDGPLLILAAGDAKVDNAKFREAFQMKARMMSPEELVDQVGHAMGGVCPFGVKKGCQVYLDISMKRFEHVYPAVGSGNSAIKMDLNTLEKTSQSIAWIDVCKAWE